MSAAAEADDSGGTATAGPAGGGAPAATEPADAAGPSASVADARFYPVSRFQLQYLRQHPDLPPVDQLLETTVTLAQTEAGYVALAQGERKTTFSLASLKKDEVDRFSRAALQQVFEALRDRLLGHDLRGVFVAPHPGDISQQGEDLRPDERRSLRVLVLASVVTDVRTVAQGDGGRVVGEEEMNLFSKAGWAIFDNRIDSEERINNPAHREIREDSPVRGPRDDEAEGDLLPGKTLDEYVYRQSRHPGRHVEATLAPAEETGGVTLDYQVSENKPWATYFQLNNTGTSNTDRLRQQFGVFDNQFTGNDDIFRLQYLTASFDDTNAVNVYYEAPLLDSDRIRWAVNANYSEFTASDVGQFNDTFTGESWEGGAELIANVYQNGRFFVDAFGGARYTEISVDSTLPGATEGEELFLLPRAGLRYEMNSRWYRNRGEVGLEWHSGAMTDAARDELDNLGRRGATDEWARLTWRTENSFFLEPIVNPEGWRDPSTPESSTLAHEVAFSFRGQTAFGDRLIPQVQQTAGGLRTVRGYPESLVAGDTVFIGSLEYRFHVPQVLGIEPQPQEVLGGPFRFAPQFPYGRADWDLVPRVFVDAAYVESNDGGGFAAEADETLLGAGVGVDLAIKRNLQFSVDWGFALQEAQSFDRGEERVHFNFVVLY